MNFSMKSITALYSNLALTRFFVNAVSDMAAAAAYILYSSIIVLLPTQELFVFPGNTRKLESSL